MGFGVITKDLVTIRFRCRNGRAVITSFCIEEGSTRPCTRLLHVGRSADRAVNCLLNNGFKVKHRSLNSITLKRKHC